MAAAESAEMSSLSPSQSVNRAISTMERISQDKALLVSKCSGCDFVKVLSSTDESVTLEFTSGEKKSEYTILFTPDYPVNTIVTSSSDPNDVKCFNQPALDIFIELCRDWCKVHELDLPEDVDSARDSTRNGISSPVDRLDSQISYADSEMTECSDDNDYNDYYDEEPYETQDEVLNPSLERDIAKVIEIHGKNSLEYRIHAGINEVDVLIYIDMTFLDVHTSSAWGVNSEEPVVIQLHLQSGNQYLDGPEPKIEVYQATPNSKERRKFGLGTQIQKIVETFVGNRWRTLSNFYLEQHMNKVVPPTPVKPLPLSSPTTPPVSSLNTPTPTNTPSTTPSASGSSTVLSKFIQKLLDMGFSTSSAEHAIEVVGQDMDKAVHLLTEGDVPEEAMEVKETVGTFPPPVSLSRQDSQGAKANLSQTDDVLENVKREPLLDNGFLAQVVQYVLQRIPSLNEFCVICDERHVLETGLLRPCVCTRELCVFAFQTLGVMGDAAESVATDANVVDLLIAMCNTASNSSRAQLILDPYPSIVDPSNPHRLALDPGKKDFDHVKRIMKAIINGREELLRGRCTYGSLKEVLDTHDRLAFPLMQWIVATNRAYIVMIPEERRLKTVDTKYQFLLISSPPAKEAAFQRARAKDGSTFAFHGSSIENWHSIMRKGLVNASGTKLQLHGAAYGSGIYLSPRSATSFGYTRSYYGSSSDKIGDTSTLAGKLNLTCIALCEVVTSKELKKSGDIWVCPNADHVVTRFFFVYDHKSRGYCDCNTQDKSFRQEILHAVQLAQKLRKT